MTKLKIADEYADAHLPDEAQGSHIRMRRDPDEREAAELAERYGAGELTLDELVGALKKIAIESMPRTAAEAIELRELLDKMDWEPVVDRLRNLGP